MTTFTLPERCDRAAAEALLPDLVEALGAGAIEIDGNAVRQVSLALLQTLASARKSHEALRILPSPALRDAAELTGLATHLFEGASA